MKRIIKDKEALKKMSIDGWELDTSHFQKTSNFLICTMNRRAQPLRFGYARLGAVTICFAKGVLEIKEREANWYYDQQWEKRFLRACAI